MGFEAFWPYPLYLDRIFPYHCLSEREAVQYSKKTLEYYIGQVVGQVVVNGVMMAADTYVISRVNGSFCCATLAVEP